MQVGNCPISNFWSDDFPTLLTFKLWNQQVLRPSGKHIHAKPNTGSIRNAHPFLERICFTQVLQIEPCRYHTTFWAPLHRKTLLRIRFVLSKKRDKALSEVGTCISGMLSWTDHLSWFGALVSWKTFHNGGNGDSHASGWREREGTRTSANGKVKTIHRYHCW